MDSHSHESTQGELLRDGRVRVVILGLLLALASPLATPAATPVMQPACADAHAPALFLAWPTQLENLAFDANGTMFVSDFGGDHLVRVAPEGATIVANVDIHGMTFGPDGLLYIGTSSGQVWRVDSIEPFAKTLIAAGLPAANGLAFDAAGNLFVSNPLGTGAPYLVRLPASDPAAWAPWSSQYGPNGLWRDGDRILAAITGDQSSPILSYSTSDPDDVRVVAQLSLGVLTLQPGVHAPQGGGAVAPKGLDDLTQGPDGMIYVAAHVTGELLRVDPASGVACVLASGLHEPTSVRFAPDGRLFVTDMGGEAVTALFGPGAGHVWEL